jgi:hypothetical protein
LYGLSLRIPEADRKKAPDLRESGRQQLPQGLRGPREEGDPAIIFLPVASSAAVSHLTVKALEFARPYLGERKSRYQSGSVRPPPSGSAIFPETEKAPDLMSLAIEHQVYGRSYHRASGGDRGKRPCGCSTCHSSLWFHWYGQRLCLNPAWIKAKTVTPRYQSGPVRRRSSGFAVLRILKPTISWLAQSGVSEN